MGREPIVTGRTPVNASQSLARMSAGPSGARVLDIPQCSVRCFHWIGPLWRQQNRTTCLLTDRPNLLVFTKVPVIWIHMRGQSTTQANFISLINTENPISADHRRSAVSESALSDEV